MPPRAERSRTRRFAIGSTGGAEASPPSLRIGDTVAPVTRIIVYTGKGGVGKTSVAAATALLAAERGYRTIVLSTDAAHSLGDSFDRALGPEATEIPPNLWGQESDVFHNIDKYWGTIQDYVSSLLRWRGLDDVMAEEMSVL